VSVPADFRKCAKILTTYYRGVFAGEYKTRNGGTEIDLDNHLRKLRDSAVAAQYQYIFANSHPHGKKSLLNASGDGSNYDAIHARIHPRMRTFAEKFSFHDVFLIDARSGDVVYSVNKKVDFGTSLKYGA